MTDEQFELLRMDLENINRNLIQVVKGLAKLIVEVKE